ncbi:MAG: signal peptidase II [Candidatus Absconditabacterales bacterium]
MKRNRILIILSTLLLVLDLGTKYVFYNKSFGSDSSFIQASFNSGISWSVPLPRIFIIILSLLGLIFIIFLYLKQKINITITAFLLAGTLGNLIDRIFLHGVRDFINIGILNFPIFNLADIFLNIGIILLILMEFFCLKNKLKNI